MTDPAVAERGPGRPEAHPARWPGFRPTGSRLSGGAAGVLIAYVVSRIVVLAATAVVAQLHLSGARCGDAVPRPIRGYAAVARCWDVRWYLRAAGAGYPHALPAGGTGQSTLAFFPGYPAAIALLRVAGIRPLVAAVAVALIAGAGATVLVYRLGLRVSSSPAGAQRAAVLFAVFPGAVVLSWGYSEALAAALAGAALVLLHRRSWTAAGLVAAAAGTVRADVWLAVSAAAIVAAGIALRHRGERRALIAAALAPLGGLAFLGFLWCWTGSPSTWRRAQSRGWGQHFDWGRQSLQALGGIGNPFATASRVVLVASVLFLAAALAALVRRPPPAPWAAYTLVLVAVGLTSSQVGFRPRAELLLLPAFVAAGDWLSGRSRAWVSPAVLAGLLAVQVLFTVLWLGTPLIAPP